MIRTVSWMALISLLIFALPINGISEYDVDIINKIRLSDSDIPEGYMYGKIPTFARDVLKGNPWMMDDNAIKRLTKRIYPEGNYNRVLKIHITILAGKETPYGDDIVCYIILYKDSHAARDELKKISRFVEFNKDRAILVKKMNLVVFFHVDDTKDFHHIRKIANRLEDTLKSL
jgi:hypothetical protein